MNHKSFSLTPLAEKYGTRISKHDNYTTRTFIEGRGDKSGSMAWCRWKEGKGREGRGVGWMGGEIDVAWKGWWSGVEGRVGNEGWRDSVQDGRRWWVGVDRQSVQGA